jgi:hypothetical protein
MPPKSAPVRVAVLPVTNAVESLEERPGRFASRGVSLIGPSTRLAALRDMD